MSLGELAVCGKPVAAQPCALLAGHVVPCSPDPNGFGIPIPTEPWTEIAPRLYMGGWRMGQPTADDFDSVLTLSGSAPWAPAPLNEKRFPINDGRELPDFASLDAAVSWVYHQWEEQKRIVLVRCQAGLNRSGLVTALVLIRAGHLPQDAIALIRERRSPFALCNPTFVHYLEGQ